MGLPEVQYKSKNAPTWWIETYRPIDQARLDNDYLHNPTTGREAYDIAKQGWIDDQTRKRELSADPVTYVPTPFTRPVPRREVSDWDDQAGVAYVWQMDPDPNIHAPVLPPYVKQQKSQDTGFVHTPDPTIAALFGLLGQLNSKLDKLLVK